MTYEPLHHKYRPQTFADLVGQEAIAQTLTNAICSERIAPAYLFTGPRGTGKTSSARIMAKSLNCLSSDRPTAAPCGQCDVCVGITKGSTLDVIEIDAASNTGVDNIRELIERAQFAPVQCRYKVYVIDEVHMLSVSAFNALLKTLEEPPKNVVFILATTDPQRVLATIISRCQRFDFRRIPLEAMVNHLQKIAEKENINITFEAIQMVAQIAQGGLRDAESLLDQLSLMTEQIGVEGVWELVGAVPERDLMALLEAIASDNPTTVLDVTRQIMDRGREPLIVLQNLAAFYRDLLIAKTAPQRSNLVALTQQTWQQLCQFSQNLELGTILGGQSHLQESEVQIKNTTQPRLWLEVTLLGLLPSALNQKFVTERVVQQLPTQAQNPKQTTNIPRETSPPPRETINRESSQAKPPQPTSVERESLTSKPVEPQGEKTADPPAKAVNNINAEEGNLGQIWERVLDSIQPYSTQVLLRQNGKLIRFRDRVAWVSMPNQALLKHLNQQKVANIEAAFEQVFNYPVTVKVEVAGNNTANEVSANYYAGKTNQGSNDGQLVEPNTNKQSQFDDSQSSQFLDEDEEGRRADREAVAIASQNLAAFFEGEIVDLRGEPELEKTTDIPSVSAPSEMQKQDEKKPDLEPEEEDDDDDIPF